MALEAGKAGSCDTTAWQCDTLCYTLCDTLSIVLALRVFLVLIACIDATAQGQPAASNGDESYKAYTEAPRLLLRPSRLRLLRRERERQSIRFQQFDSYIQNRAAMPEQAFALALAARVADETNGKRLCGDAYNWLAKPANGDLRQRALTLDWCSEFLSEAQNTALAKAIETKIPAPGTYFQLRDRAFAALALFDRNPTLSEKVLRETVQYWRTKYVPGLKAATPLASADIYPLFELMHALRDNLELDLRQDVGGTFFADLPLVQMLGYYPAAYPGPDSEFRVAFFEGDGDPDLKLATMMRAAEFAMVAYDNNAELSQSLQGWLLQDRYLLRDTLGIPYEYLWANPYQPGLTYHHLPNSLHDKRGGRLFLRSNWEEEARFICYYDRKIQLFEDGKRKLLRVSPDTPPIEMGDATVLVGAENLIKPIQFQLHGAPRESWYIIGLRPNTVYDVEVDDQELDEARTDSGGILSLDFTRTEANTAVRVNLAKWVPRSE